jgi:lipopolysaccharide transport system ATP-binding protein
MFAIQLKNVTKIYNLYGSQKDQFIDLLGLERFGIKPKAKPKKFVALNNISLELKPGQRIGIIGRNGAGKTTLLKLLCGNFIPTQGSVKVNGAAQALMSIGLGFHPEFTGRENVESSLQYSGLSRNEYEKAIEGIVDFCELGEFLDQPFKTYSLGMQARLMFAAATAIKPDILIVDEVLGAGDAYFVAKSKIRMEKLVNSGCTMLLVSHSMQQVLELCDEVIWLDKGAIHMQGDSFSLVKAYEEHLHTPIGNISNITRKNTTALTVEEVISQSNKLNIQEPNFVPFSASPIIPNAFTSKEFNFVAKGGISRWAGEPGLKICGFSISTEKGINNKLVSLRPAKLNISISAETEGRFDCRYGIAIHDHSGRCITTIFSPRDSFFLKKNDMRMINIHLNPCQLGTGDYVIGVSILNWGDIEMLNSESRYDLLSRSFLMSVEVAESMSATDAVFYHNAEWIFS